MKPLLTLLLFFISLNISSQKVFQGNATYKTHKKLKFNKINDSKGSPDTELQKQFREQIKKMYQKTFVLNFTKTESTYSQKGNLTSPQINTGGIEIESVPGMGSVTDILYKNLLEKKYVNKVEVMGKRFLIKDKIRKNDWTLTNETKNIGIYTCYKATKSRQEEKMKLSVINGQPEVVKKKITINTVAWYTPQIPISNGPKEYGGLPGLILEVKDNRFTIVCTEIVLNSKRKIEIKKPKKGKKVTQKQFDEIINKKKKETIEHFKSSRRGKKNNGFTMEVGG